MQKKAALAAVAMLAVVSFAGAASAQYWPQAGYWPQASDSATAHNYYGPQGVCRAGWRWVPGHYGKWAMFWPGHCVQG